MGVGHNTKCTLLPHKPKYHIFNYSFRLSFQAQDNGANYFQIYTSKKFVFHFIFLKISGMFESFQNYSYLINSYSFF